MSDKKPIRITLEGSTYYGKGRLFQHDWDGLREELQGVGAQWSWTGVHRKLDFFIAGAGAGSQESKARAYTIPILKEAQLATLIEEGHLDYLPPEAIASDTSIDELLGEVRGALAGEPTADSWTRCLEAVERCQEDQLELLLNYLEGGLARWKMPSEAQWSCATKNPLMRGATKRWLEGCPEGELRVAPPLWLFAMANGERSRRFSLARALNFNFLKLTAAPARKMLFCEDLTHVTHVNLGERNRYSAELMRDLANSPLGQRLEQLTVWDDARIVPWLYALPPESFPNLDTLRIHTHTPNDLKAEVEARLPFKPVETRYVSLGYEMLPVRQ